jgi:hypothetical protein
MPHGAGLVWARKAACLPVGVGPGQSSGDVWNNCSRAPVTDASLLDVACRMSTTPAVARPMHNEANRRHDIFADTAGAVQRYQKAHGRNERQSRSSGNRTASTHLFVASHGLELAGSIRAHQVPLVALEAVAVHPLTASQTHRSVARG